MSELDRLIKEANDAIDGKTGTVELDICSELDDDDVFDNSEDEDGPSSFRTMDDADSDSPEPVSTTTAAAAVGVVSSAARF